MLVGLAFASASVIVVAFWLRSQTTDRICEKIDTLTAALVVAGTRDRTVTVREQARIDRFIDAAACDPADLDEMIQRGKETS